MTRLKTHQGWFVMADGVIPCLREDETNPPGAVPLDSTNNPPHFSTYEEALAYHTQYHPKEATP